MNIIITGVSSFSGAWFSKKLLSKGHKVLGFSRNFNNLSELQLARIDWIKKDHRNFQMINLETDLSKYDIERICLHGTATFNYRSPDFNIDKAVEQTFQVTKIILNKFPNAKIIHTGTFSERDESVGVSPRISFNNYSESKARIFEKLKSEIASRELVKYVMPNPFGPLEPPKFIDYLLKTWANGEVPQVNTPNYIRDNVPIDLLADHYALIVEKPDLAVNSIVRPSKYIESVGTFAKRYAFELNKYAETDFQVALKRDHAYDEPRIRVNSDYCEDLVQNWDEAKSWSMITRDALFRLKRYSE